MVEIQKNIPYRADQKWPFLKMEVGDSVRFVQSDPSAKTAQRQCHSYGQMYDMKFKTKTVEENGIMVIRIWRAS